MSCALSLVLSSTTTESKPDPSPLPVGPLRGSFPILALRTNKADVAVGVDAKVAQELDEKGEKWRVNGKFVSPPSAFSWKRSGSLIIIVLLGMR